MVLHDTVTRAMDASHPLVRDSFVFDSSLSEAGVLGFEYGYSVAAPRTLTLWEAQYGDFVNAAQVIVDQFIAAGEEKWGQRSRLVLLLPHGQEGQGPEHSSARPERFHELAIDGNLQVCQPTTPAQYFHLLRRQMARRRAAPLVVLSPKSLLRLPASFSGIDALTDGKFEPVIADTGAPGAERVVLCGGKVYYDVLAAREKARSDVAILRVEQLAPFPEDEVKAAAALPGEGLRLAPGRARNRAGGRLRRFACPAGSALATSAARHPRPRRRVRRDLPPGAGAHGRSPRVRPSRGISRGDGDPHGRSGNAKRR
jgi:2-oxoglutarate dehydrogenase complex dehydrogenase (E1) component-like enzyme